MTPFVKWKPDETFLALSSNLLGEKSQLDRKKKQDVSTHIIMLEGTSMVGNSSDDCEGTLGSDGLLMDVFGPMLSSVDMVRMLVVVGLLYRVV